MSDKGSCLVIGAGPGLGAAVGRRFAAAGHPVALAARTPGKVDAFVAEIEAAGGTAKGYAVDGTDEAAVVDLVAAVECDLGPLDIAVYNASGRVRKPIAEIGGDEFIEAWMRCCHGGFLLGREAARRMTPRGAGSILFTGATASVKSYAGSSGFSVGKFGLRALAESMARELAPKGVHVAHFVIDGGIGVDAGESRLDPDAIAESYYQTHAQARSAWSWEIELRPWTEHY